MNRWKIFTVLILCCGHINPSCQQVTTGASEHGKEPEIFLRRSLKDGFEIKGKLVSFLNNNFIVHDFSTDDRWVLRVTNEISNLLSDRWEEKEVLTWARQEGLSLIEVKACDPYHGYLLTRFLSGQSASAPDFQNQIDLKNALKLLYRLHSNEAVPISTHFSPLALYSATSSVAEKRGLSLPIDVHKIASQLKELWSQIPASRFQSVPCHNDPSPENFFHQNNTLYLHDWELAGLNDPMWDLTHFSVIAQIDPEKILALYPTADPFAVGKMTFFRPFVLFNTVVWASLERQQQFSSIPSQTTEKLYQIFLEKVNESLKSSSFQDSLQKLIQGVY